ncbi:MAG: hypothetical protein E7673_02910 [Ruminococcaceae bacterium]|nr:hypothetical protein [Oscillospiraceae bacterium]
MLSVIADLFIVIFGCLTLFTIIGALILQSKGEESVFTDDRIEKKVEDIRNTVCMLSDLILEETPAGQRFLEKHPDCFESSARDKGRNEK